MILLRELGNAVVLDAIITHPEQPLLLHTQPDQTNMDSIIPMFSFPDSHNQVLMVLFL